MNDFGSSAHSLEIKNAILKNFDVAIKINFQDALHKKIFRYANSLNMYAWFKLHGSIGNEGSFLMFSFNDRRDIDEKIDVLRTLIRNEVPSSFAEYACGNCTVFTF